MHTVLFICTGNTCRSSMAVRLAAEVLKELAPGRTDINFISAGVAACEETPAHPNAVAALGKMGIDLAGHRARNVTPEMLVEADLVLTMEERQKALLGGLGKVYTLKEYAGAGRDADDAGETPLDLDVPDPIGQALETYIQCAEELRAYLRPALERFLEEIERNTGRK